MSGIGRGSAGAATHFNETECPGEADSEPWRGACGAALAFFIITFFGHRFQKRALLAMLHPYTRGLHSPGTSCVAAGASPFPILGSCPMSSTPSKLVVPRPYAVAGSDFRSLLAIMARDLHQQRVPLLVLLLAADIVFIAMHLVYIVLGVGNVNFALTTEHGYSEVLQYMKAFWIGMALLWLWLGPGQGQGTEGSPRSGRHVFVIWGLLFFYLALDDAAGLHERAGQWMAQAWNLPVIAQLRSRDLGELIFAGGVAGTGLSLASLFYFRGDAESKRVSRQLIILLAVFGFFAVGVDMLAMQFKHPALDVIEDGGELLVMSLILVFVLNLQRSDVASPQRRML